MVWVETPTNPRLEIIDIAAVAGLARERGAWTVVDNTLASPYLQQPLALGADVVMHSTTKYLGGHSDVLGGWVGTSSDGLAERLEFLQTATGAVPGPIDAFLIMRGVKTLAVRMERHCANAAAVAEFLAGHPAVASVLYPGLASHPGHDLAAKQMSGFGGMVSFSLAGGEAAARKVCAATRLFALGGSLGGVESLISYPPTMSHFAMQGTELAADPALVRLSVGIEAATDLIADLDQALASLSLVPDPGRPRAGVGPPARPPAVRIAVVDRVDRRPARGRRHQRDGQVDAAAVAGRGGANRSRGWCGGAGVCGSGSSISSRCCRPVRCGRRWARGGRRPRSSSGWGWAGWPTPTSPRCRAGRPSGWRWPGCLVSEVDLLILDEPTNHLDIDAIDWLEARLARFRGGLVLVTHDRHVLDRVTTRMLELDRGRAYTHDGGYASYLDARAVTGRAGSRGRSRPQQPGPGRAGLAAARRPGQDPEAQSPHRRSESHRGRRPRRTPPAAPERSTSARAAPPAGRVAAAPEQSPRRPLGWATRSSPSTAAATGSADEWLFRKLDVDLEPGGRLALVGPNGSGKTTLLDILAGRLTPTEGRVETAGTVVLSYYDQTGRDLDPDQRVREVVAGKAAQPGWEQVRLMERFRFDSDLQWATIGTLSGGERRRLQLLLALTSFPNVLLLDEPTNDLDLDTLRALEDFLETWPGSLVIVSHDRALLERTAEEALILDGRGGAAHAPGGYAQYEEARRRRAGTPGATRDADPRRTLGRENRHGVDDSSGTAREEAALAEHAAPPHRPGRSRDGEGRCRAGRAPGRPGRRRQRPRRPGPHRRNPGRRRSPPVRRRRTLAGVVRGAGRVRRQATAGLVRRLSATRNASASAGWRGRL